MWDKLVREMGAKREVRVGTRKSLTSQVVEAKEEGSGGFSSG